MRSIKYILALTLASSLLVGCDKFVSKDDINPNQPVTASLQTQLPVVEVALYAAYTGNMARVSNLWGQQLSGTDQQGLDYANYKFIETDVSNDWTTIYNAGLLNCNQVIEKAGDNNPYYAGIAKVSKAMFLGIATDYWGDIPNKEATLGVANFNPHYERQEEILQDIQQLLDDAIADFGKDASANTELPDGFDYIFAGDVSQWKQAAIILKARYANRLTKRNGASASQQAASFLAALGELTVPTSKETDGMYAPFSGAANELNQWFSFEDQRPGYFRLCKTMVDTMAGMNDPRLPLYAAPDDNGGISGTALGDNDVSTSYVGSLFAGANSSLPLVTVTEALFIQAEALLRANAADPAGKAAYEKAVTASMTRYGVSAEDAAAYISSRDAAFTAAPLEALLYEKWVSDFTTTEVWSDWRRTGVPNLHPNPTGQGGIIPRRWPTEQRERINNANATVESDITKPVWWDGGQ